MGSKIHHFLCAYHTSAALRALAMNGAGFKNLPIASEAACMRATDIESSATWLHYLSYSLIVSHCCPLLAERRRWAWILKRALSAPALGTDWLGLEGYPAAVAHYEDMVKASEGEAGDAPGHASISTILILIRDLIPPTLCRLCQVFRRKRLPVGANVLGGLVTVRRAATEDEVAGRPAPTHVVYYHGIVLKEGTCLKVGHSSLLYYIIRIV